MLHSTSSQTVNLSSGAEGSSESRLKIHDNGVDLRVEIPWGHQISAKLAVMMVFVSFFFAGVLTLLGSEYLGVLLSGQKNLMYLMIGVLWFGEFVFAWILLAKALNSTILQAKADRLLYWDDPISVGRVKVLRVNELSGFSLERPTSLEKQNRSGRAAVHHIVCAHLRGSDKIVRICEVQDVKEGVMVQHLLESKLGLLASSTTDTLEI